MSANSIQGFEAVLGSISGSPHPYIAIANYLVSTTVPPGRPVWAQVLTVCNICASFALLSAALLTCLIRARAAKFSLGSVSNGRVWRPNAAIGFALGCIVYSILAILDLSLALAGEHRHVVMHGRALLASTKFIPLWVGLWCFSWNSLGQYVCSRWDPPWQSAVATELDRSQIPPAVAWTLNLSLALLPFLVCSSTFTIFSIMESRTQDIASHVSSAVAALKILDASKTGDRFNLATALHILQPLAGLQALGEEVVSLLKAGVLVWIIALFIAILTQIAFIPLVILQTRLLGPKMSFWMFCKTVLEVLKDQPSDADFKINYARETNVSVLIAATIVVSGLFLAPLAIWQYVNATLENLNTESFRLTTELTASCAVSFIVNIVMWKILFQAQRFAKAKPIILDSSTSESYRMSKSVFLPSNANGSGKPQDKRSSPNPRNPCNGNPNQETEFGTLFFTDSLDSSAMGSSLWTKP